MNKKPIPFEHFNLIFNNVFNKCKYLQLSQPITFNKYQSPIKISRVPPQPGQNILVSGYGLQGVNNFKYKSIIIEFNLKFYFLSGIFWHIPIPKSSLCSSNGFKGLH